MNLLIAQSAAACGYDETGQSCLPYTGAAVWLVALIGVLLLLVGLIVGQQASEHTARMYWAHVLKVVGIIVIVAAVIIGLIELL